MFNKEYCTLTLHDRWSLKFLEETLVTEEPGGFVFLWGCQKMGTQFFLGGEGAVTSIETMVW